MGMARISDPDQDFLTALLEDVGALRDHVVQRMPVRLAPYGDRFPSGRPSRSVRNLGHYLALREQELRPLQARLASAGLSSLGRGESHTLANLERVIDMLCRAVGTASVACADPVRDVLFQEGDQCLEANTDRLFGPPTAYRRVRIMVTLPGEAARDYALLVNLLRSGMDCARINCAHDDATAWLAMITHLRRAEAETGRQCRVLMDLAGHKLRTGPLESGPAVCHVNPPRDGYGRILHPARLLLTSERLQAAPAAETENGLPSFRVPDALLGRLSQGDQLHFTDTRGKARRFECIEALAGGAWLCHCDANAYVPAGAELEWCPRHDSGDLKHHDGYCLGHFDGAPVEIRVGKGDVLLLARESISGRPAVINEAGEVVAPAQISCSIASVIDDLQPGAMVWVDDGKLGARVESVDTAGARLRVTTAGTRGVRIRADKGLNFPDTRLQLPALSDKDRHDLDFVCGHADLVGYSFVQSLADMDCLLDELAARDAAHLPVIAKIETARAVKNLPEILLGTMDRHPLGIMIARGDLAVELGSVRMAEIQEEILWLCEAAHVPVIWATQVLESLAKKGISSRPEITDAAMGVRAECVMLNKGPYILDAVQVLGDILFRMQPHQKKKISQLRALHW